MVASSLNDITLVGHNSYFFVILLLTVLLGLEAERQGFSGCGRQHWYIQCPLGVCILFIIYTLFDYCCSKTVCCENLGMTARLSVARSVPVLTAVVTVVSDSPASSIRFYSQRQRFFELFPST